MSQSREGSAGKAIITFARGWQTLAATRSLGRRGVEVVTADEYALTPASFSRYSVDTFRYPSPSKEPERFLDELERRIREHRPTDPSTPYVLMPIHAETYLIAKNRSRFESLIRVPVPDIEQIELVHDKGALALRADESGIPIPRTWLPESVEHLEALLSAIPLPAFIKLRTSAAGVGIAKVGDAEELRRTFVDFLDRYAPPADALPLVQEGVPGDDYCVTTLFEHGKLRACMTYRNLRAYPADTGAGVLRETVAAPAMERVASDLLGPLGWHGVAEVDFRWTGDAADDPKLIEVNPRFWGGLNQAIESGWDYPWLLYRLAVDGRVDSPTDTRDDVRTETPILAFLATVQDLAADEERLAALKADWRGAKGEFREGSKRAGVRRLWSGLDSYIDAKGRVREVRRRLEDHRDNVYDVLSSRDPLPALGVLYPLAVFLKHGKVNMELLTSEGGAPEDDR